MKILSICSGAGGIDEGIKQAGLKTTLAIDNWKDACETMKLNHDCEVIRGDILDHEDSFGKFDCVVGGVPCPEFSSANVSRTFDDTLVKCFWRIVEKTGVKYWLMENVPGVIQVCKKRNLLIDCADYGTPQHRIRRFFTNLQRPLETHGSYEGVDLLGIKTKKWINVKEALGLDGISFVVKSGFEGCNQLEKTRSVEEPAMTITASDVMRLTNHKIYSTKKLLEKKRYDSRSYFHELDKPGRTIMGKDLGRQPSEMISDGEFARKLTLKECAIIQGFPPNYKFYGNKTSKRRQIGNAVPPQPIKAFFEKLLN